VTQTVPKLRNALKATSPTLAFEKDLWNDGHYVVVGMDEVGRGAWAGPITVGAAVVPRDRRVYKIRDSKMLTESERERLFDRIASWCTAWAVGHAGEDECDEVGMVEAQKRAAARAIAGLPLVPDFVLYDGNWNFTGSTRAQGIVRGDAKSLSIAAASILAKVTRDRIMRDEAHHYPHWAFASNKGYPGPRHKAALAYYGPSAIHRRSWVFMEHLPYPGVQRYVRPDPQGSFFD
jgi:ribonuclease HII